MPELIYHIVSFASLGLWAVGVAVSFSALRQRRAAIIAAFLPPEMTRGQVETAPLAVTPHPVCRHPLRPRRRRPALLRSVPPRLLAQPQFHAA